MIQPFRLLITAVFAAFATLASAQADGEKALVKTLDPKSAESLVMDVNFPVNGQEWGEPTVRVLLEIHGSNVNVKVIEQLVKAGRYSVEGALVDKKFVISMPGLKKEVTYQGVKVTEQLKATLFVPSGFDVAKADGDKMVIESQLAKKLAIQGLAARGKPFFQPVDCSIQISCATTDNDFKPEALLMDGVVVKP